MLTSWEEDRMIPFAQAPSGRNNSKLGFALLLLCGLSACVSIKPSTALPKEKEKVTFQLERSLPKELPGKSIPFSHSQFVLLPSESALVMLSPVPFVGEAVEYAAHKSAASGFETKYREVHPFFIMQATLKDSTFLASLPDTKPTFKVQPFVFIQECFDDRYRLTYVTQVTRLAGEAWVGRYLVHLPTTYSKQEFKAPTPELLGTLRRELVDGSATMQQLLERAARGELKATVGKAEIGSFHLVGIKASGLLSPSLLHVKDAEIIEEDAQHLVVRIPGNLTASTSTGALFFGVHHLRKDQLHTFKKAGTPKN